ncbi:hypothetical protein LINGRAHAP2_LOCUS34350 [Linum grandiflorum]
MSEVQPSSAFDLATSRNPEAGVVAATGEVQPANGDVQRATLPAGTVHSEVAVQVEDVVIVDTDAVITSIISPLLNDTAQEVDDVASEDDVIGIDDEVALSPLKQLKNLNKLAYSGLSNRVVLAETEMVRAQGRTLADPSTINMVVERNAVDEWSNLKTAEEIFFKQKACIDWIADGDTNTSFFFNSVKAKQQRNFISQLISANGGVLTTTDKIASTPSLAGRFY